MVYSTATPGILAETFRERFNKPNLGKSVHGFINDTVYLQTLPYNKKAGHARYSANDTHAVDIANYSGTSGTSSATDTGLVGNGTAISILHPVFVVRYIVKAL